MSMHTQEIKCTLKRIKWTNKWKKDAIERIVSIWKSAIVRSENLRFFWLDDTFFIPTFVQIDYFQKEKILLYFFA